MSRRGGRCPPSFAEMAIWEMSREDVRAGQAALDRGEGNDDCAQSLIAHMLIWPLAESTPITWKEEE